MIVSDFQSLSSVVAGLLSFVWRLSGMCLKGVSGICPRGVWLVSGGCLTDVWRVSGGV